MDTKNVFFGDIKNLFISLTVIYNNLGNFRMFIFAGGGGGIRTHETVTGLTVFKTVPFDHSGTPPFSKILPLK